MSFPGTWHVSQQQISSTIALDNATPIVLAGSLGIEAVTGPERISLYNSLYTPGLTAGAIQSIFRITTLTTTGTERVGFVFMQNNPTLYGGSDVGYGVFFNAGNNLSSPSLSIVKYLTGLPATPIVLINTTSFDVPALGEDFMIRAQWISSLGILGGTQIQAYYAVGTDFLDVSRVLETVDTTSPIVTTSYESLAFSFQGPGDFHVLCDETSVFEVV